MATTSSKLPESTRLPFAMQHEVEMTCCHFLSTSPEVNTTCVKKFDVQQNFREPPTITRHERLEHDVVGCHVLTTPFSLSENLGNFISRTQISRIRAHRPSRAQG